MPEHPEFELEAMHLHETVDALQARLRVIAGRDYSAGDDWATEMIEEQFQQEYYRLRLSLPKPYFGRIDFHIALDRERGVFYIGRAGFQQGDHRVIDWRAPLSTVFYQARRGQNEYQYRIADGRTVSGRLYLKREYEIDAQQLQRVLDYFDERGQWTGGEALVTDPDDHLKQVLAGRRDTQLRDIVETIQQQQDDLIREAARQVLVVQGAAGSGKTSVALHRLAFLLYPENGSGIHAQQTVVFGPNRLFLGYIANVLPNLLVEGIYQTTLVDWEKDQLGLKNWIVTDRALDMLMSPSARPHDRTTYRERSRLKTGRRMARLLERYAEHRRRFVFPERGWSLSDLGPLKLSLQLAQTQLQALWDRLSDQSLLQQRQQFIPACAGEFIRQYEERVRSWTGGAGAREPLNQERRRTSASSEETRREVLDRVTSFVRRQVEAGLTPVRLPDDYYALLDDKPLLTTLAQDLLTPAEVQLLYGSVADMEMIDLSDLPGMVYLRALFSGVKPPFEHIVVDEAQDVSPLEYELLRRYTANGSMTILGDMAQGIYPHRGLANWEEVHAAFGDLNYHFAEISQSYRTTYEIMQCARQVLKSMQEKGYAVPALPRPLERHGVPVAFYPLTARADLYSRLRQLIMQLRFKQWDNIAILCKDTMRSAGLAAGLQSGGLDEVRLVTAADARYAGGIVVAPVHLAKGMEFEVGLVVDVDAQTYTESEFDGRLLYVALTRALHELHIFWAGDISPHLEKASPLAALSNPQKKPRNGKR
ncbi:MAG: UvrD-helicase domain-containing protein [Anaerolineae bacterium]